MSHSPDAAQNPQGDYLEGWLATEQQVREGRSWSGYERHCGYLNVGDGKFVDIAEASGVAFPEDGRALAVVDWDGDGDLDLWFRSRTSPGLRFLRNNLDRPQRAVGLLLEARAPNTGAVGARVELHAEGTPWPMQRRTVRAGSGYLSQSSKRLQFGLGDSGKVTKLVVHWPDGSTEEIQGLTGAGRFRVKQGSGRAEKEPARGRVRLSAEPVGKVAATDASQLVPLGPLPLPDLALTDPAGAAITTAGPRERPLLLLAWATWCKPCHGELRELAKAAARLEEAGLDVLLVSVDTAPDEPTATPAEVQAWLDENGVPFRSALASAVSVQKLELLHEALVNRTRALALPSSLIVGTDGQLVAYRRGPAGLAEALEGLELAGLDREERARRTTQADGLWVRRPRETDLPAVAGWFTYRGFEPDARAMMQVAAGSEADRAVSEGEFLRAKGALGEAETLARRVLDTWPEHPGAIALLGLIALEAGRPDAAEAILTEALGYEPERTTAWINLSNALSQQGEHEQAVDAAHRAVKLEPWNPDALHALAAVELTRGNRAEGVRALRESLRLDPTRVESARALAQYLGAADDPQVHDAAEADYWNRRADELAAADRSGLRSN